MLPSCKSGKYSPYKLVEESVATIQLTLYAAPLATVTRSGRKLEAEPGVEKYTAISQQADGLFTITATRTYDFRRSRGASTSPIVLDCDAGQIIEVELVDGGVLYLRLDELQALVQPAASRAATESSSSRLTLTAATPISGVADPALSRGLTDIIKTISLPEIDWLNADKQNGKPVDTQAIANHFVTRLQTEKEGMLRWDHTGKKWQAIDSQQTLPPSEQPLLLLIHGTASSTEGSFGDLWWSEASATSQAENRDQRSAWFDFIDSYYFGRVYAFEHDTLTRSPVQNARDILSRLPKGQQLHVLSHSRGGLVGELLCLSMVEQSGNDQGNPVQPISKQDIERFSSAYDDEVPKAVVQELRQLNRQLVEKAPVVERFVRVACPMRGTTLASGRLDLYLSVMATAVQWFARLTNPKLSRTVDTLKSFAIIAAKERFQMEALPGLESMIPNRGLTRLLNDHASKVESRLTVIAGNAQADGFSRQTLLVALSNSYYWERNDFVVETGAMRGGLRRSQTPLLLLDKSKDVNHFSYFKNETSLKGLYNGLKPLPKNATGKTYSPRSGLLGSLVPLRSGRRPESRGVTIIVPAFAATHLLAKQQRVWLKTESIAAGKLEQLSLQQTPRAQTDGWIESRYQLFADYLERGHAQTIVSFPYDWRLSTEQNAREFTKFVQQALSYDIYSSLPVRIVAHSTGGYIVLRALHQSATLRKLLIQQHDMQLFLAGMPFNGTFYALELLKGVAPLLPYLTLIDRKNTVEELQQLFSSFPGLVDMLPSTLEQANRSLHKQLSSKPNHQPAYTNRIHYLAGSYPRTPIDMQSTGVFSTTAEGDGSARWSEIPDWIPEEKIWYMGGIHGNLLAMPGLFPALAELVIKGDTKQISHTRPLSRSTRSLKHRQLKSGGYSLLYPDQSDIENVVLRSRSVAITPQQTRKLPVAQIRIVSGDLRYITQPVLVGHYLQDGIKSAEAVIDEALEGGLSDLYRKNLYPGELESVQVVTQRGLETTAFGAVVVGLGTIGSLTVRKLRSTLKNGFISYGLHQRELRQNCGFAAGQMPPIALASLLIGTGSGGVTIEDSVMALLRALSEANQVLVDMRCEPIMRLDIVELYEDVAISAARSLEKIQSRLDVNVSVEPLIVPLCGLRKRAASQGQDDWWQHIQVIANKKGNLTFSPLTARAGLSTTILDTQAQLIDTLVKQSTRQTVFNRQFSQTLFKLLIPNEFKGQVLDDNGVVLLLNKQAAQYPWEMLVPSDEGDTGGAPFAIETGLVRKLHTTVDKSRPAIINQRIMIVGDPLSSLPELPGAQQEAEMLRQLVGGTTLDAAAHVMIRSRGVDIVSQVMNAQVQVLHLAGHGVYVPPGESYAGRSYKKGLAGMVLGEGIFLTDHEVQQLEFIPELIFINACYLGRIMRTARFDEGGAPPSENLFLIESRASLAASLGTAFIEAGAKCVIAAGWEVDDDAALEFAGQFYEQMILKGNTFGEACKQARVAVYNKFPRSNTWGAYQAYGDPQFRLTQVRSSESTRQARETNVFHSPRELIVWAENFCARPELNVAQNRKVAQEARFHMAGLPDSWKREAAVLEALGNVFARVNEDVKALECYQQAMVADNAHVSLQALENRVRLLIRLSEEMFLFYSKFTTMPEFDEYYIKTADKEIKRLLEVGENRERLTLQGHVYRHYGQVKLEYDLPTGRQLMRLAYQRFMDNSQQVFERSGRYDAALLLEAVSVSLGINSRDKGKKNRQHRQQLQVLKAQLEATNLTLDSRAMFSTREAILRTRLLLKLLNIQRQPSRLALSDLRRAYVRLLDPASEKNQARALRRIHFLIVYLSKTWSPRRQAAVTRLKALYEQVDLICNRLA